MTPALRLLIIAFCLLAAGAQATDFRQPGAQRCAVVDCNATGGGNNSREPAAPPPPDPDIIRRQQEDERLTRLHDEAYRTNQQGLALYAKRDFAGALALFLEAIEKDPGTSDWRCNRDNALVMIANDKGLAFYKNADFANAIASFQEAMAKYSNMDRSLIKQNLINAQQALLRQQTDKTAATGLQQAFQERSAAPPADGSALDFTSVLPPPVANYVPSGNGFVGGTSWIVGYNLQSTDPVLVARSKEMLRQQLELAGIPYNAAIDFQRYNFVIGIGASTDIFTDLRKRVVFDQLKNGRFTRDNQAFYNSLKGRQFDELGCHSNGAMICLAALQNKDITVGRVVLYGPQVTPESLQMWNELVRSGQVKSVQLYINEHDPVPPVSMFLASRNAVAAGLNLALFKSDVLVRTINETAPRLAVRSFACDSRTPTLSCHDMAVYKSNSGCVSRPSGLPVAGTALPGRGSLSEPPPPC
jgi:tetratricopeptide (TPR) repeat protein